jgi:hypothetical protein
MLSGEHINEEDINGDFPNLNYKKGDFLLVRKIPEDGFEGMFIVLERNREKLTLEQINCSSFHWRTNFRGEIRGPNEDCKSKCEYFGECPIKDYMLLLKSGFE